MISAKGRRTEFLVSVACLTRKSQSAASCRSDHARELVWLSLMIENRRSFHAYDHHDRIPPESVDGLPLQLLLHQPQLLQHGLSAARLRCREHHGHAVPGANQVATYPAAESAQHLCHDAIEQPDVQRFHIAWMGLRFWR